MIKHLLFNVLEHNQLHGCLSNGVVRLCAQNLHEALQKLECTREIEVKAELEDYFFLHKDNVIFDYYFTPEIDKSVDHIIEIGLLWLLEFGRDD